MVGSPMIYSLTLWIQNSLEERFIESMKDLRISSLLPTAPAQSVNTNTTSKSNNNNSIPTTQNKGQNQTKGKQYKPKVNNGNSNERNTSSFDRISSQLLESYLNQQKSEQYKEMLSIRQRLPTYKQRKQVIDLLTENNVVVISGKWISFSLKGSI